MSPSSPRSEVPAAPPDFPDASVAAAAAVNTAAVLMDAAARPTDVFAEMTAPSAALEGVEGVSPRTLANPATASVGVTARHPGVCFVEDGGDPGVDGVLGVVSPDRGCWRGGSAGEGKPPRFCCVFRAICIRASLQRRQPRQPRRSS